MELPLNLFQLTDQSTSNLAKTFFEGFYKIKKTKPTSPKQGLLYPVGTIVPKGFETLYFKFKIQIPLSRLTLLDFEKYAAYLSHQYNKLGKIKELICLQHLKYIYLHI